MALSTDPALLRIRTSAMRPVHYTQDILHVKGCPKQAKTQHLQDLLSACCNTVTSLPKRVSGQTNAHPASAAAARRGGSRRGTPPEGGPPAGTCAAAAAPLAQSAARRASSAAQAR